MDILRTLIRHFDSWLSQREGVIPFTDDSHVILRIQTGRISHDLCLPTETVRSGSRVLLIHAWNERMPRIPDAGADLAYGLRLQRLIIDSYKAIAQHILADPSLQDVQAVGGVTVYASRTEPDGGHAMFEHMGFTVMPYHRPFGAFGEFWENFYAWWLMWTYNPVSVKHRSLWGLQRTEFWMTKDGFLQRYG
jgi:YkoP-like protein